MLPEWVNNYRLKVVIFNVNDGSTHSINIHLARRCEELTCVPHSPTHDGTLMSSDQHTGSELCKDQTARS